MARRAAHPRPAAGPSPQGGGSRALTKDDIFHYVYGVLFDPPYREKCALSLKREFPRIPFYLESKVAFLTSAAANPQGTGAQSASPNRQQAPRGRGAAPVV
ncbi:MAG: hypothetical protein KF694_22790 [Mesorhizobium sp.]|nr:hypothetical protein [Mesorhizobium sp.]